MSSRGANGRTDQSILGAVGFLLFEPGADVEREEGPIFNCRSVCTCERGQSITEFAVLAPVLILLLVAALDIGRAYDAYVSLTNASREGARYGASNPADAAGITNHAIQEAGSITISPANVTIACTPPPCATTHNGDQIRVTVTYDFQFLTTEVLGLGNLNMVNYTVMAILNGQ